MSKIPLCRPMNATRVVMPPPRPDPLVVEIRQKRAGFVAPAPPIVTKAERKRLAEISRLEAQIEAVRAEARALVRAGLRRGSDQ